jgi:hypothetical protein
MNKNSFKTLEGRSHIVLNLDPPDFSGHSLASSSGRVSIKNDKQDCQQNSGRVLVEFSQHFSRNFPRKLFLPKSRGKSGIF